ncbi:hypothetical protein F5890DRAFT_1509422 [Lentinula detonsa]|uniref:Nucleolus and neural progenitor protein-like N-terminal domain-containing protein n=1 Tax=Lentinula detonsa TaxID=2804962 RepID=A0AA38Q161_9AGAR|nr:hypothetical protein F5890DRAFT_1509422 [Lentinula detonsa]
MNARRTSLTPSLSERGSLPKNCHATVDSVLKDLKLYSRRLSTTTTALAEETQILDRLHYKNKNQHRSSLFIRRLNELRRYSHRTEEFQICSFVNDLRQSFFGKADGSQQKQMKGAWSHHPDEEYVSKVKEQSSCFLSLLRKMYAVSSEVFRSLSLAMQTGAFIHLFLTLIAITSKIANLVAEMIEILQLVIPVMDRLLAIFKACKETADSSQVLETQSSGPTPVPIQISTLTRKEEPLIAIERRVVVTRSKLQPDTGGERPRKKRKEVKKNEIDVIFGSY